MKCTCEPGSIQVCPHCARQDAELQHFLTDLQRKAALPKDSARTGGMADAYFMAAERLKNILNGEAIYTAPKPVFYLPLPMAGGGV